jgi:heptosyltransferase-3
VVEDPVPVDELRSALVIKLRHLGDVLLASPVFSVLKSRAPRAQLDALVYAECAPMLTGHPSISRVHCIDRAWRDQGTAARARAEWRLLSELRARRYDLIVHLTEHWRGAWLTRALGARWAVAPVVGARGGFWRRSFTHFVSEPRGGGRHVVERNLDALRRIGIYPGVEERALTLIPGAAAEERVTALLAGSELAREPFVQVHPSSRWRFKCWPAEKMAAFIDRLHAEGWRVVLTAAHDPVESQMIEDILSRVARPVAANFCGQLSLKELAALTARARLFVGVDSAPMHIAAAVGTPALALFGPSGEALWAPWGVPRIASHRVVASEGYSCRPCGLDGCGGGKVSDCLVTLEVERVWAAARGLLAP